MSTVTSSTPTPITAPGTGDFLSLTDAAVAKVKFFAGSMPDSEGKPLRIFVQGGGCSGFQYGFTFDEKKDGRHGHRDRRHRGRRSIRRARRT